MFFHSHVSFFKRPRTQYWMAGGAAVVLGLTAGLLSRSSVLQGDLHDVTSPKDFALTEVGVDEAGYVYGVVQNNSDHQMDIALSVTVEGEVVAATTAAFEPGVSMNLSPGLPMEPGSESVQLCASVGEEELCLPF